jgi:serine/threonine-protein kinase
VYPWRSESADPSLLNFGNNIGHLTPVGLYPLGATPDAILDMAGNVWEWVADWYGKYDPDETASPRGSNAGTGRVLRGGCWFSDASGCRSACRYWSLPADHYVFIGFRPARSAPSPGGSL